MLKALSLTGALIAGVAFSGAAVAEDQTQPQGFDAQWQRVADVELDAARGMANPFVVDDVEGITMTAVSYNNYAESQGTGSNYFTGSFNGASGVATVVQAIGNNIIVQTLTNVTVNYVD
jgi:hypothetical protein